MRGVRTSALIQGALVFAWLFETSGFVPRAHCGAGWDPAFIAWAVAGNLLLWLAYLAIPITLYVTYVRGGDRHSVVIAASPHWSRPTFAAFILLCGIGHLWDAVVFRWPAYRLFVLWHWLTAAVSWATVVGVAITARRLREWRSPEEWQELAKRCKREAEEAHTARSRIAAANAELQKQIEEPRQKQGLDRQIAEIAEIARKMRGETVFVAGGA